MSVVRIRFRLNQIEAYVFAHTSVFILFSLVQTNEFFTRRRILSDAFAH